jgi:hypothetical protein
MGTYSSGNGYLLEVSGLCQRIVAEDTPRLGERHLSLKAMHEDRPRWIDSHVGIAAPCTVAATAVTSAQ